MRIDLTNEVGEVGVKYQPEFRYWLFDPHYSRENFQKDLKGRLSVYVGFPLDEYALRAMQMEVDLFLRYLLNQKLIREMNYLEKGILDSTPAPIKRLFKPKAL